MTILWLLLAALCQTIWIWSTTRLSGAAIKQSIRSKNAGAIWNAILPLLVYLASGISNVVLLTMVMDEWPASLTYGVWTGLVMGLAALREWLMEKKPIGLKQAFYLILIGIGTVGLQYLQHDN